ncbi:MAG: NAD(P)-binding protein [Pseudomonadales bacterium]|nr:NAD(P)-binding protein [Pseudomonadales bacterium]
MTEKFDVVIIGAGISGLYQLHKLRKLGLSVRVYEAGDGVGGTWYWNRYPGARFDSESYSYQYAFSQELLDEWNWSEHFAAQPETLRYVNFVADKLDLRRDVRFSTYIAGASFDEKTKRWTVRTETGELAESKFLITAIGPLSVPTMPNIEGVDDFNGDAFHTGYWPQHDVKFEGRRVAVIGTGATGVQLIQEVAKTAGTLTVFQRNPNWCAPLHNSPIDDVEQPAIHARYAEVFELCRNSHGAFMHTSDTRNALDLSKDERDAVYEKLYGEPGFGIWMGNFRDLFVDEQANATLSEFVANKIRERVDNPAVAEKLIPTNHGFGLRRVPMETNYYEVYNQDNVRLIDLGETPIERINATGIQTSEENLPFDMIIYATGFDAVVGGFNRLDIRGVNGQTLNDKWARGPRTHLGMQVSGFPNLFTLVGPHNAASFCNIPRCIEQNVEWVSDLVAYMTSRGLETVDATVEAEDEWTEHVYQSADRMLLTKVDSWFNGINSNIPGRQERNFLLYAGGAPAYRERCDAVATSGYSGMTFE